jgi:hypothetical protein
MTQETLLTRGCEDSLTTQQRQGREWNDEVGTRNDELFRARLSFIVAALRVHHFYFHRRRLPCFNFIVALLV